MDHHQLKEMDCEKAWSNCKDESSNPATYRRLHCPPSFWNSSYISANTNPEFYNIPHYGTPKFQSYLTEPCLEEANPYHPCYKHGEAMVRKNFHPIYGAQPNNSAMDWKNYSQVSFQQPGMHYQSPMMRSNRKNRPTNKRKRKQVNAEKSKNDTFLFCSPELNDINTKNNNQQKNFYSPENVYNSISQSQFLSTGIGVDRNDTMLLNEWSSNETNLQYELAQREIQTKSSTRLNFADSSTSFLEQTNEGCLDFVGKANICDQNSTKFENESIKNELDILDDALNKSITDVNSIQPLDLAQIPDASEDTPSLHAHNTTTLAIHNNVESNEKTGNTFILQTLYEGQDENGKDVIVLLAAPEVQQQILQANSPADSIVQAQSTEAEKSLSTTEDAGIKENNFISNGNSLPFETNKAGEILQTQNLQNDGSNIFTSTVNENFGYEEIVKTSKGWNYNGKKKRKQKISAASQTQTKRNKLAESNNKTETIVLEKEAGPSNLNNKIEPCQPRLNKKVFHSKNWRGRLKWKTDRTSFRGLQDLYFNQFAQKYFREKCVHDKELQDIMRRMLGRIGGSVLRSIYYSFEALERFHNAKTQ